MRLDTLNCRLLLFMVSNVRQRRLESVGVFARELPCRDLVVEKQVEFRVGQVLGLWKAEVSPRDKQQRNSSPEEAALGAPVPLILSDHLWHNCVCDKYNTVVASAGKGDGLDTETCAGDFSGEGVADGPDRQLVLLANELSVIARINVPGSRRS
jgi:hypothetical protein